MTKPDISENQANKIFIGIGSNLGVRIKNIEKAKFLLIKNGIKIVRSSTYYESQSWPDISKPKYLNIVLQSYTTLRPTRLIEIFKSIEKNL